MWLAQKFNPTPNHGIRALTLLGESLSVSGLGNMLCHNVSPLQLALQNWTRRYMLLNIFSYVSDISNGRPREVINIRL